MSDPVICFGQQPCGFFPRRFLYAKIVTARRLQAEIGGRIVFFLHDSDHDPRETQTILRHRKSGAAMEFNFSFANRVQRRWSPQYAKRVLSEWRENMARQLPAYAEPGAVAAFKSVTAGNVADFCLDMYARMGLLAGIEVVRSSDPAVREKACAIQDYFVDVTHEGECVRARRRGDSLVLHQGGESYFTLPPVPETKAIISPSRDSRLLWMQSVIHCTHYIAGAGEQAYLNTSETPEITFIKRDPIDRSDEAYAECPS